MKNAQGEYIPGGLIGGLPAPPLPPPSQVKDDWGNVWHDSKEGWQARAEYLSKPWWVRMMMPLRIPMLTPTLTLVGERPESTGGEFVAPVSLKSISLLMNQKFRVLRLKLHCKDNIKRGVYVFKPAKR